MICEKCKSNVPDTAKFCPKCGRKFEKTESTGDTIFCPKCGTPYPTTSNFCRKDGTPLKKAVTPIEEIKTEAAAEPKVNEVAPVIKTDQKMDTTKIDDQKFNPAAQPAVKKITLPKDEFSGRTPKTWISILTVICLAAVAGSYVYFSNQAGEESAEIPVRPEPKVEQPVSPPVYKPEPPKSFVAISKDRHKIEGEINRAFREAGLSGITAVVSDSLEVTLKGSVISNYEKDTAFEIARIFKYKGIKRIKDMIFVVEQ